MTLSQVQGEAKKHYYFLFTFHPFFFCFYFSILSHATRHATTRCTRHFNKLLIEKVSLPSSLFLVLSIPMFFYIKRPNLSSFFIFCPFLIPLTNALSISTILIEKSIDGVHGIQTRVRRMEGSDESTELWQPPLLIACLSIVFLRYSCLYVDLF